MGNRRGVKWYTCTQKGCKSAWGKSFEMCAHLIGNKNKHNRNFLANHGYPDADGFTQDKLLATLVKSISMREGTSN